jgi:ankyrin repeat protein
MDAQDALSQAIAQHDLDAAIAALDAGASVSVTDPVGGYTPLHVAAQENQTALVDLLLRAGADPNAVDRHGNGALWTAVFNCKGNGDVIALLRDAGADPRHTNSAGRSPLDLADTIANYPVAELFNDLEAG